MSILDMLCLLCYYYNKHNKRVRCIMDKEKWVEKMKSNPNTIWIEPPSKERHPVSVANEIWYMYDDGFDLTISEMCDILLCNRNWIMEYVKDNVKHIFLSNHIRRFMRSISNDREIILKDYYFFDRNDFYRWLRENTIAEKQSMVIDMYEYSNNKQVLDIIIREYKSKQHLANSMIELAAINAEYMTKIHGNLNPKGKELFSIRTSPVRRDGKFVEVDFLQPDRFASLKELRNIYVNNERVYRSLYECGAIKYTICDSLVRFDYDYANKVSGKETFVVPYERYLELK